jgi:hypothetical protein
MLIASKHPGYVSYLPWWPSHTHTYIYIYICGHCLHWQPTLSMMSIIRFQIFTVVVQIMVVFWVLRLCSVLCFFCCWRRTCFLHLRGAVKLQIDEDGQCTYNVIVRHVCVTIVAFGRHYYLSWVCVCSLSYPASKACAPHFIVICGLSGCTAFFHII